MNIPSIIGIEIENTLNPSLFEDLQIKRLLSPIALEILSHPVSAPLIKRRQELFACLANEEVMQRARNCHDALSELKRIYTTFELSDVNIEKMFLFACLMESYIKVINTLQTLGDECELIKEVSSFWNDEEHNSYKDKLVADMARAREWLGKISGFLMSFSEKNWATPDTAEYTLNDTIKSLAENLTLPIIETKKVPFKIDKALSEVLYQLYAPELSEIQKIYAKYPEFNSFDISFAENYIKEFAFCFEIYRIIGKANEQNMPHCYPEISEERKYLADSVHDISLFLKECDHIVPSDSYFSSAEPFFFLTGANGGGKTTYIRATGINLILFLAGCPVFAKSASIYPFKSILSHFPSDERFTDIGRFTDEQNRVREMLDIADEHTFMFFNETFSGTDDIKGCEYTLQTSDEIMQRKLFGLFVTHFHEVNGHGIPVLNATVSEQGEDFKRTFKILRSTGMMCSYAHDILKKYRLDAVSLDERRKEHADKHIEH